MLRQRLDMALQHSDMLRSRPSLMNSGKLGAVPTDHRRKIGSRPRKNCDLALIPVDPALRRIKIPNKVNGHEFAHQQAERN
jgi:hypothetical protein